MTLLLTALLAVCPTTMQDEDSRPPEVKEIEELGAEMAILARLNTVGITKEQAEEILEAIEEVQDELKESVEDYEDVFDEALEALKEARETLAAGKSLSKDQEDRILELTQSGEEAKQAGEEIRAGLAEKLRDILKKKQIQQLTGTGIPKVWRPFRQAVVNGLAGIRQMNEDDFEFEVGDSLEQQLEGVADRFGGLSDEEFEKEHERIMDIFRKMRKLDDSEFRRKQGDLVDQIFSKGKLGEFGRDADEQMGNPDTDNEINTTLTAFFLNPLTIRALKSRVKHGEEEEERGDDY